MATNVRPQCQDHLQGLGVMETVEDVQEGETTQPRRARGRGFSDFQEQLKA